MENKQTFLNFSRNYNIIDGEGENNKEKVLDETSKENFTSTSVPKRLDKRKKNYAKKKTESKNPYLKKAEAEKRLIKITKPRLLLTGATAAHGNVNNQNDQNS